MNHSKSDCPVCAENYNKEANQPYCLSCGHTICESCVDTLQKVHPSQLGITCPICKIKKAKYAKNYGLIEEFETEGQLLQAQQKLEEQPVIADGLYKIQAKHSGKYLGIKKGTTNKKGGLVQNEDVSQPHQVFKLLKHGDSYMILVQHTKLTLQIRSDYVNTPLARIIQDDFNGEDHQLWKLEKQEDGSFFIISKKSSMCFDVDLYKKSNDTPIIQYAQKTLEKAQNQLFNLVPVVSQ